MVREGAELKGKDEREGIKEEGNREGVEESRKWEGGEILSEEEESRMENSKRKWEG